MIPSFLRPFLAAVLMIPLLSLAGWATAHGIEITDEQVHKAVDYVLEIGFPVLTGLAVIVRRLIDKKANPGNAASSHVAEAETALAKNLKATERVQERQEKAGVAEQPLPPKLEEFERRHWYPPEDQP